MPLLERSKDMRAKMWRSYRFCRGDSSEQVWEAKICYVQSCRRAFLKYEGELTQVMKKNLGTNDEGDFE